MGKNPGWFYQWLMVEVVVKNGFVKSSEKMKQRRVVVKKMLWTLFERFFAKAKTMERRAGLLGCSPILGMMKIISWDAHPGFRVITRIDVIQSWWFRNQKKHQESLDVKRKTTSIYIDNGTHSPQQLVIPGFPNHQQEMNYEGFRDPNLNLHRSQPKPSPIRRWDPLTPRCHRVVKVERIAPEGRWLTQGWWPMKMM